MELCVQHMDVVELNLEKASFEIIDDGVFGSLH